MQETQAILHSSWPTWSTLVSVFHLLLLICKIPWLPNISKCKTSAQERKIMFHACINVSLTVLFCNRSLKMYGLEYKIKSTAISLPMNSFLSSNRSFNKHRKDSYGVCLCEWWIQIHLFSNLLFSTFSTCYVLSNQQNWDVVQ